MPKTISIQLGDRTYPFRMTLGAMLRFKRTTGKEVTALNDADIEEVATLLYCVVASASSADKVPFDLSFDDFCDHLSAEDMDVLTTALSEPASDGGEEKKS